MCRLIGTNYLTEVLAKAITNVIHAISIILVTLDVIRENPYLVIDDMEEVHDLVSKGGRIVQAPTIIPLVVNYSILQS